jgi:FixJ family two-component response regulator
MSTWKFGVKPRTAVQVERALAANAVGWEEPLAIVLISVIDDDESSRLSLASLMRSLGFRVNSYASADEFLESGTHNSTQCIITDLQMPGTSGIQLKRWLDAQSCRTPVIMITARPEVRLHAEAIASGAFCLLKKPFDAAALVETLEKALAV